MLLSQSNIPQLIPLLSNPVLISFTVKPARLKIRADPTTNKTDLRLNRYTSIYIALRIHLVSRLFSANLILTFIYSFIFVDSGT